MSTVADKILIAKVCEYLIANDNAKKKLFQRGGIATYNPELIYIVRKQIENVYNRDNSYDLQAVANYLYWLCGKYTEKAKAILLLNNTGYSASSTMALASAIRGFNIELLVGTDITVGATSYTISLPNIVFESVEVQLPQANLPEGDTDQLSFDVSYSPTAAVVSFTNNDNTGTNIGLQSGMLILIHGYRLVTSGSGQSLISNPPPAKFFTGADLDVDSQYIDTSYLGYDVLVQYLDFRTLKRSEYNVLTGGGVQILIDVPHTSDATFLITPNGLL